VILSLLPVVLPAVRRVASSLLVREGMVLRDEREVAATDEEEEDGAWPLSALAHGGDGRLPLGPIGLTLDGVQVVDAETLCADQESMPEFAWPEKELAMRMRDQQREREKTEGDGDSSPSSDDGRLLVLDVLGLVITLRLGEGIELQVPVDGPAGTSIQLEVGAGGTVRRPYIELSFPRLRIWYARDALTAYAAVMARPTIAPHFHVNADRGRGDFLHVEFSDPQGGGLDDVVESVLCGFGPSSLTCGGEHDKRAAGRRTNFVADALGRLVTKAIHRFGGVDGGDGDGGHQPIKIDLAETVRPLLDAVLGSLGFVRRPAAAIQADIALLEAELGRSLEKEKEDEKKKKKQGRHSPLEEKKDDEGVVDGGRPDSPLAAGCSFWPTACVE